MDANATPFTRAWCCFEQAMVVNDAARTGDSLLLDAAHPSELHQSKHQIGQAAWKAGDEECASGLARAPRKDLAKRAELY